MVVAIVGLLYMTFQVSGKGWFRAEGYRLSVVVASAGGLDRKAPVQIAGVEVGRIETVTLAEGGAKVTLRINPEVQIKKGATAMIQSSGLLGDRFVEILPGTENGFLIEGDSLMPAAPSPDMHDVMGEFIGVADTVGQAAKDIIAISADIKAVTAAFRETFASDAGKKALQQTIENARRLTGRIDDLVRKNQASLGRLIANMEGFSKTLAADGDQVVKGLNRVVKKVDAGEGTLGKLLNDDKTYEQLNQTMADVSVAFKDLDAIAKKVERGEGTIGKLFSDEDAYDNLNNALSGLSNAVSKLEKFKTFVGFRDEYRLRSGDHKGTFSVRLQPRTDKYYLLEATNDPRGRVTQTDRVVTTDGVPSTITELKTQDRLKLSAQFGKRVSDVGFRIGLFESSMGVGSDYYFWDDALRLSADVWDFTSDDPQSPHTHVKLTAGYTLFDQISLEAGYDQILNPALRTFYIGTGIRFEDDDMKYLLSGLSGLAK